MIAKGVSQFVAAALLVVIVVSAGFFLSQWYMSVMKTQTEEYEEKYEEQSVCAAIDYAYYGMSFNTTGDDIYSMYVDNKGTQSFTLQNIVVFGTNGNLQEITNTYGVAPGETKRISFWINVSLIGSIDLISMDVKECPEKSIKILSHEIDM